MTNLDDLGCRICIIGPSSNGKSTLAQALGQKLNLSVCHLDQIAHIPHTNWEPRDKIHLQQQHQLFLDHNHSWIMEGNYSFLMKDRFTQATSIIWLDFDILGSVFRYLKRTFENSDNRPGNLAGATKQFSLQHIHYMVFQAPKKRATYKKLTEESTALTLRIHSFPQLLAYYKHWNLQG